MAIEIQSSSTAATTRALARRSPRRRGVSRRDRMFFTERLGLLLDTGHPLHVSLETLGKQEIQGPMGQTALKLYRDVAAGKTFAQALDDHPEVFPRSYIQLAAAGERGGFLPEVLDRIYAMEAKLDELRSATIAAFSYPLFLVAFSIAVIIFVLTFVFPRFSDLFELIGDELPGSTRLLMGLSDLMRGWWPALLAGAAVLGVALWRWGRTASGRTALDRIASRTPLLGQIIGQLNLVQFLRIMSISLDRGVPLVDALRSAREVVGSPRFRRFIDRLDRSVQEGGRLSASFREARFLPALARQMVATGEESGNLAHVMGRVADFYEREWNRKLALVSRLIEPIMLLAMGGIVGLIVSSLILPIFKLSHAVH